MFKQSTCSSYSGYWRSLIRKQGRSVCKFLYVLAAFLSCARMHVYERVCCVHHSRQRLLSLLHNGRVSGEFYHWAWLFGGLRGRGALLKGPRWRWKGDWIEKRVGKFCLSVCVCVRERQERPCVCVKVKRAAHERAAQKNRLPSMPQGFPYSLHRWVAT